MDDAKRLNEKAMNASINWAAKEAAEHAARPTIPDNCIVRNGQVVGTDQRTATYAGDKTSFIPSQH